jgi:hypothetical protein
MTSCWEELWGGHRDWGRDGVVAVATGHLGWRMVEVVGKIPGVGCGALAQGVRRFWRMAGNRPELEDFVGQLIANCQK